jgi:hypothetical protein
MSLVEAELQTKVLSLQQEQAALYKRDCDLKCLLRKLRPYLHEAPVDIQEQVDCFLDSCTTKEQSCLSADDGKQHCSAMCVDADLGAAKADAGIDKAQTCPSSRPDVPQLPLRAAGHDAAAAAAMKKWTEGVHMTRTKPRSAQDVTRELNELEAKLASRRRACQEDGDTPVLASGASDELSANLADFGNLETHTVNRGAAPRLNAEKEFDSLAAHAIQEHGDAPAVTPGAIDELSASFAVTPALTPAEFCSLFERDTKEQTYTSPELINGGMESSVGAESTSIGNSASPPLSARSTSNAECYRLDNDSESSDGEAEEKILYLPQEFNGVVVLELVGDSKWQSTNEYLKGDALGLGYRYEKRLDAKKVGGEASERLDWGEPIDGVDEGDGWIRVTKVDEAEDERNRKRRPPAIGEISVSAEHYQTMLTRLSLCVSEGSVDSLQVCSHCKARLDKKDGETGCDSCFSPGLSMIWTLFGSAHRSR